MTMAKLQVSLLMRHIQDSKRAPSIAFPINTLSTFWQPRIDPLTNLKKIQSKTSQPFPWNRKRNTRTRFAGTLAWTILPSSRWLTIPRYPLRGNPMRNQCWSSWQDQYPYVMSLVPVITSTDILLCMKSLPSSFSFWLACFFCMNFLRKGQTASVI